MSILIAVRGSNSDRVASLALCLAKQGFVLSPSSLLTVILDDPIGSGWEWLRCCNPHACIFVTDNPCQEYWLNVLTTGVSGFLAESSSVEEVITAIQNVSSTLSHVKHSPVFNALTSMERQVLSATADGLKDQEIGERLGIKHGTVRNHISRIMERLRSAHSQLRFTSRTHLAFYYLSLWHKIKRENDEMTNVMLHLWLLFMALGKYSPV